MADYVTLLGAEDVQSAGRNIAHAATTMESAASSIAWALEQHQRFMDDWLSRLDGLLSDRISEVRQAAS